MSQSIDWKTHNNFRALFRYISPYKFRLFLGFIAILYGNWLAVKIPAMVRRAIDDLGRLIANPNAADQTPFVIYAAIWGILLLAIGSALGLFFSRYCIITASRLAERQLRIDLYDHLQRLSLRFYHSMPTGDLLTRGGSDIEQVRLLWGPGIMYPTQCIVLASLAVGHMLHRNWVLTVAVLTPVVGLSIWVNVYTRRLHRLWSIAQKIYAKLSAHVQENLSGIRVVKAYCQEIPETERFREINQRYLDQNLAMIRLRGKLWPFMRYIGGLGFALILCFGGWMVAEDRMTLGGLAEFIQYFTMLFWPIIGFGWVLNVIHRGTASWARLREVFAVEPEIMSVEDTAAKPSAQLQGHIEIRDLTFRYSERTPPVLKDISLTIPAGSTTAVVGPTGVGKSTLVHLLLRLYPVPRGKILIDDGDINDIPLEQLRGSIAFVSQEVFLFSDRLSENILFGDSRDDPEVEERMREAARKAGLASDIDQFPNGYETLLGERGLTLSGGQRQRTGIARALVLGRPILILDDCLSSVDAETEEYILRSMEEDVQRRTTILISHRISTVRNADHIVVLSDGKIIEQGRHEQLLSLDGLYTQMFRRQQLEESLGIRR